MLRVSKSSVSLWVRDIELTPEQVAALRPAAVAGGAANSARARERHSEAQLRGRIVARRAAPLHAAGCMLFWAEGSRNRNAVVFTNSDPAMIAFFLRFLREVFAVPDSKVRVTCNLFADHAAQQAEIEQYWLDLLSLPALVALQVDGEQIFEVQPEEAAQQAAVRDVSSGRPQHAARA